MEFILFLLTLPLLAVVLHGGGDDFGSSKARKAAERKARRAADRAADRAAMQRFYDAQG